MSTDKVQQELQDTIYNYIHNKSVGKVLAVNGLWGTGKTYLWKSFFKEKKTKKIVYPEVIENIRWIQVIVVLLVVISLIKYLISPYCEAILEFYGTDFLLINLFILFIIVVFFLLEHWTCGKYISEVKTYSYVSLFGINSLEDFKLEIFRNISRIEVDTDEENKFLLKPFAFAKKNIFPYLKGLNLWLVRLDFTSLASNGFNAINNSLICIDDLERRGNNLDIKDIMGLVSLLKEQKKCTIILLYNDDINRDKQDNSNIEDEPPDEQETDSNNQTAELKRAQANDFNVLLEKVIDISFIFQPTSETCFKLALEAYQEKSPNFECDNETCAEIKKCISSLSLINIRVIVLILNYLEKIKEDIIEPKGLKCIISRLVLFVCCRYIISEQFPDWSLLKDLDGYSKARKRENVNLLRMCEGKKLLKEDKWVSTFIDFGINDLNIIDNYLIKYIDTGFSSDKNKLTDVLNDVQFMQEMNSFWHELSLFWKDYEVFRKTSSDLKEILEKLINSSKFLVTLDEFDKLVNLIESVWGKEYSRKIIDHYTYAWEEYFMYTDKYLEGTPLIILKSDTLRERLIKFGEDLKKIKESHYGSKVLWNKQNISKKEVMNLSTLSNKELETAIKATNIRELKKIIRTIYCHDSEQGMLFYKRIKEIVKKIVENSGGKENFELNKKRYNYIFDMAYDEELNDQSENN